MKTPFTACVAPRIAALTAAIVVTFALVAVIADYALPEAAAAQVAAACLCR